MSYKEQAVKSVRVRRVTIMSTEDKSSHPQEKPRAIARVLSFAPLVAGIVMLCLGAEPVSQLEEQSDLAQVMEIPAANTPL
jgi:hypothetical protein